MRLLTAGSLVQAQHEEPKQKDTNRCPFCFAFTFCTLNQQPTAGNVLPKAMAVATRAKQAPAAGGRRRELTLVQAQENCKRKRSSTTKVPNRMVQAQHEELRRSICYMIFSLPHTIAILLMNVTKCPMHKVSKV